MGIAPACRQAGPRPDASRCYNRSCRGTSGLGAEHGVRSIGQRGAERVFCKTPIVGSIPTVASKLSDTKAALSGRFLVARAGV